MRAARRTALACAVLAGLTVTACSGDDASSDEPAESEPTAVAKLSDIPDAVLLIKPGSKDAPETYRTAKVTSADAEPDATSVTVNYKAGPDVCSFVTGYATQETETDIEVTVILGEQEGCTGKSTTRTTVLRVDQPVGDREIAVSEYSQQTLPIKKPGE